MSSEPILDRLLRPALERAVSIARSIPAPPYELLEVPSGLRPLLHFAKLPPRALAAARQALDDEPGFLGHVAAASSEVELGSAGWLFVTRPAEWREQLERLVAEAELSRDSDDAQAARREVAHLKSIVADLENRLGRADAEGGRLGSQLRQEQASAGDVAAQLRRVGDELEQSRSERGDAIRRLKELEARLALRTAEIRELRSAAGEPASGIPADAADAAGVAAGVTGPVEPAVDVAALAEISEHLADQAVQFSSLIERLRSGLGLGRDEDTPDSTPAPARPDAHGSSSRRRPAPLRRGVLDDTSEAAEQLFSLPGAVVLVDGYNVAILAWSDLTTSERRHRLEQVAVAWHARYGADFVLVFDGDGSGGRAVRTAGSPVRVVFTPATVEADDEILARIAEIPPERPCIVVSDDRRVRDGAWQRGANVVGSRQVLSLLRSA